MVRDVDEIGPDRSAGVLVTACTQGYAQQHGKSRAVGMEALWKLGNEQT